MAVTREQQEGVVPVVAGESPAVDHLAWKTELIRLGQMGVNLTKTLDALDPNELAFLTNGVTRLAGGIQTAPGLTQLLFAGAKIHSAVRLNDPNDSATTLFWGIDGTLQRGVSGVPDNLESGFSGNPLSFSSWQSENSGEPWLFVADTNKMRKASRLGNTKQIGLPRAAQPSSITVNTPIRTDAAGFEAADGTQASAWTGIAGVDTEGNPTGIPTIYDAVGLTTTCVNMATVEGAATTAYFSGMSMPRILDLSVLPGPVTSTDEDQIHFGLRINFPNKVQEVRLYFVVGPFTGGVIPGTQAGVNTSAYVRAFRSSDFSDFVAQVGTALSAESAQRAARILANQKQAAQRAQLARELNVEASNVQEQQLTQDELNQQLQNIQAAFTPPLEGSADVVSSATLPGADTWTNYGENGLPLRKSDFLKIGQAGQPSYTWANISGIVITVMTKDAQPLTFAFDECWLEGGYAPDTSEPDALKYDYRVVNVDRATGARSNPSNVMYEADGTTVRGVDVLRGKITIQPAASGLPDVYQEAYRRGGAISDNWYGPIGDNNATGDGQPIIDTMADATALVAGAVEIDHDQPVTTTDENGNAVYGEPLSFLLPGPIDGLLFGGGDRYRPGDIYWCKPGEPDHWPAFNHAQICPPSEKLLNGALYGGQGFVFSSERMYNIQTYQGNVSSAPTDCAQGLVGRNALATGPGGIFFVSRDAVRVTTGGISVTLSDAIRPLFHGETVNGYAPINFALPDEIKLQIHGDDLWFGFIDTSAVRVWWVYSLIFKTWRCRIFGQNTAMVYSDPQLTGGLRLLVGSTSVGRAWVHAGITDDGTVFNVDLKTGAMLAATREEKLFGDVAIYGDLQGALFNARTRLNADQVENIPDDTTGAAGYREYLLHPFGTQPQHGSSISLELSWPSNTPNPVVVTQFGISLAIQPEITMKRATTWQPMNQSGEAYLYGCWIDCDTFGNDLNVLVEGLLGGIIVQVKALLINSDAGRRLWFDWPAVHVDMIRLRPTGDCGPWMLFGQGWLTRPEPARLPGMDSGFINLSDSYYTGLDIEIDTFGNSKTVVVTVDGEIRNDPATGLGYFVINTPGRRVAHLTLPWGRGHIYRFYSNDLVPVLVYSHKWHVDQEPSEQANWNQNFTIAGTHADKWLKGVVLECDTFAQTKLVNIEVDGVAITSGPFQVIANGRKVVQFSFPQVLGRVFRLWPGDNFPGRLYSLGWIFDQEPYQLTRFETQEITLGIDDWKSEVYGQITYKGTSPITLTALCYGQNGQLIASDDYTLPPAVTKSMYNHKPLARKGAMYKYILTSASGFWPYREESWIEFRPWQGGPTQKLRPFGNDDLDPTRSMVRADLAAARSGGTGD